MLVQRLKTSAGEDADVVIWNVLTGEKIQVISFPFSGQVSAVLWIPAAGERAQRLALGFADGSIHVWVCIENSVSPLAFPVGRPFR